MPLQSDAIIAVIKPSGYKIQTNKDNLPQFFYNHKPAGSPKGKFEAVAPTGKLPESVNFGLLPQKETNDFTALILEIHDLII